MHATLKNLELLAEEKTVAGALAAAGGRKVVTVQPWVETRDGKRYLHIPPDAGYRNLFRELPPTAGIAMSPRQLDPERSRPQAGAVEGPSRLSMRKRRPSIRASQLRSG